MRNETKITHIVFMSAITIMGFLGLFMFYMTHFYLPEKIAHAEKINRCEKDLTTKGEK